MKLLPLLATVAVLTVLSFYPIHADDSWRAKLHQELPLLGHRNWIVVVDSAYPLQTSPGVETVETNEDAPTVMAAVLKAVNSAPHVRPILYTDAELPFVSETDAPGITAYRAALKKALDGKPTQSLLHEQIIAKLDEAGKTFHVLILKTKLTLPYTSLFLQLQCGYWSADAEAHLRAAMPAVPAQDAAPAAK
jgi:hypothetical protein